MQLAHQAIGDLSSLVVQDLQGDRKLVWNTSARIDHDEARSQGLVSALKLCLPEWQWNMAMRERGRELEDVRICLLCELLIHADLYKQPVRG